MPALGLDKAGYSVCRAVLRSVERTMSQSPTSLRGGVYGRRRGNPYSFGAQWGEADCHDSDIGHCLAMTYKISALYVEWTEVPCGTKAPLCKGGWPCASKVWGIVPQRLYLGSGFRL